MWPTKPRTSFCWPLTKVLSSVLPGAQASKLPPSCTSISVLLRQMALATHLHGTTCHTHTAIHHCPPITLLSISYLTIGVLLHPSTSVPLTHQSILPFTHPSIHPFVHYLPFPSFPHLPTHLFLYPFIYMFIHPSLSSPFILNPSTSESFNSFILPKYPLLILSSPPFTLKYYRLFGCHFYKNRPWSHKDEEVPVFALE